MIAHRIFPVASNFPWPARSAESSGPVATLVPNAVSGYEKGAFYTICNKECSFAEEVSKYPAKLRICFHMRPAYGRKVHPECIAAVEQTCKLLDSLGHEVEESAPAYDEDDAALQGLIVIMANAASLVDKLVQSYGRSMMRRNIELPTFTLYRVGQTLRALDFMNAKRRLLNLTAIMDQTMSQYDMILTPTLGQPPVLVGSQQPGRAD